MPVRIPGLGLVHADVAVVLVPTERPVVRDVAPDQAAPVTHPNRALAPERTVVAHAVPDALQRRVALDSGEALVTDVPRRLRVGDRRVAGPVTVAGELIRRRCEWRGCGRGRRRRPSAWSTRVPKSRRGTRCRGVTASPVGRRDSAPAAPGCQGRTPGMLVLHENVLG